MIWIAMQVAENGILQHELSLIYIGSVIRRDGPLPVGRIRSTDAHDGSSVNWRPWAILTDRNSWLRRATDRCPSGDSWTLLNFSTCDGRERIGTDGLGVLCRACVNICGIFMAFSFLFHALLVIECCDKCLPMTALFLFELWVRWFYQLICIKVWIRARSEFKLYIRWGKTF